MTDHPRSPTGIAEHWCEAVADILHSMADERPSFESAAASGPPPAALLWWQQALDTGSYPFLWVGAPEAAWHEFGKRTLEAAGIGDASAEDARNTYFEILNQSLGVTAGHIGKVLSAEVNCGDGREAPPAEGAMLFQMRFRFQSSEVPDIWFGLAPEGAEAAIAMPSCAPGREDSVPDVDEMEAAPALGHNVDLLYDVELPVIISFGRASLTIKDVLKLSTGSIVELNRGVSEPVEVVVNNCVVARGEVVVVEGNYGVRIQEIISRRDRMRSSYR
jgi:flagellar motor switch protein FliN/FliY